MKNCSKIIKNVLKIGWKLTSDREKLLKFSLKYEKKCENQFSICKKGSKQKHRCNRQYTWEGFNGAEKLRSPKGICRAPTECTYVPNFNFLAQFRGKMKEEQHFFGDQKRGEPHITSPNWLGGLIFGYVIQLLILYRLAEKGTNFAFLIPQHRLPKIEA